VREPTFHILLIGADGYFPNRLSNGGSYRSLGGCAGDVSRVKAALEARLGGHRRVFTTLVAPAGARGEPTGDPAWWPTAANIRRELGAIAERAQPGDQVYLHYSGHGGRAVTAFKELKGSEGIDETLVPIDIGRPDSPGGDTRTRPERYIRDVELALYLDRLAQKADGDRRVTVTLVFDSCHSGGATRGLGDLARRSAVGGPASTGDAAGTLDRHDLPAHGAYSAEQVARMVEAHLRLRASATRSAHPAATSWLPEARGYVLLAACRDIESAVEASINGRPRTGLLTDALLEALDTLRGDQTWKTVYDRILARTRRLMQSQTPQLLGDIGRHVFGVDLAPIAHTLAVTAVDPEARTVTVTGGLALSVVSGTELGIYLPGTTDFSLAGSRLALATVVHADPLESRAKLDDSADPRTIDVGAPVAIHALSLRHKVELLPRTDLSSSTLARQEALLAALARTIELEGNGFLEVCPAGTTPDYQVALSSDGHFEICDPQGKPFPYLEPRIKIGDPRGHNAVVAQLRRLGRYHTVLQMEEPTSDLRDQLRVELLVAPPGWQGNAPPAPDGGTPAPYQGDAYTVPTQTWMWLRLTNLQPSAPLNVAMLDLNRKWEIELIIPNPQELGGKKYESIADQPRTFAFKMYTPVPEAIDVLKLFISDGDVDFPALVTSVAQTRSAARGAANALGRLIDAINATERPRTREVATAQSTSSPWTVVELRMRTLQKPPSPPPSPS
jgi:hypothetical protein